MEWQHGSLEEARDQFQKPGVSSNSLTFQLYLQSMPTSPCSHSQLQYGNRTYMKTIWDCYKNQRRL